MASVMFFGQIPSTLALPVNKACNNAGLTTAPAMMAPQPVAKITLHKACLAASRVLLESYEKAQQQFESRLDKLLEAKREAAPLSKIVRHKGGYRIRWASAKRVLEAKIQEEKRALSIKQFMDSPDTILHKINNNHEENEKVNGRVSCKSPYWKRSLSTKAPKRSQQNRRVNTTWLMNETFKAVAQNGAMIEACGKRRKRVIKCCYKAMKKSIIPCFDLPHCHGIWSKRELIPAEVNDLVKMLVKHRRIRDHFVDSDVQPGWSGMVIPRKIASSYWRKFDEVIVRGRLYGRVEDARTKLPFGDVSRIHHYSNEKLFFEGWQESFKKLAPAQQDHVCKIMKDNRFAGKLAATVVQIAFPCHKLTCDLCRRVYNPISEDAYRDLVNKHIESRANEIGEAIEQYPELKRVVARFRDETLAVRSFEPLIDVRKLTLGHRATQMQQIQKMSDVLMKGMTMTENDLEEVSKNLLEITRWFSNHLSLVDRGSLRTFRNKRSSKAMVNPSLLCDNQRDTNGNFIWGQRSYHARRFFSNFLEEIDPTRGYERYIIRKCPNGERKLAIGNLIVNLDFERTREALKGEEIEREPLTEACVSRRNGNFVYPCCCVTEDDGRPLYSHLKSPTKRHLMIGASGDPKILDLPSAELDKMYIAKQGYCYLNIFLAMLVNVSEEEAKFFTKMVRDVLIPKLGEWPTMHDVATACYIATIFYPDVSNAELPRILVDHAQKTMHVIDSFGSLSTGYHVLKAGTVSQLIDFASNDLDSELKFYKVGGSECPETEGMINRLIKGIYRPKSLIQFIEQDPYVLMMALCSPKLLISLYNNGSLELATQTWIKKDKDVSLIFMQLSDLAKEMSKAELLIEQLKLISESAMRIRELQPIPIIADNSCIIFNEMLMLKSSIFEADEELSRAGFANYQTRLYEAMEKMYQQQLEQEWRDLGWFGKLSLIIFSQKHRPRSTPSLPLTRLEGLEDKFAISATWCAGKIKGHLNAVRACGVDKFRKTVGFVNRVLIDKSVYILTRCLQDVFYFINVAVVAQILISTVYMINRWLHQQKVAQMELEYYRYKNSEAKIMMLFNNYQKIHGNAPTKNEFIEFLRENDDKLCDYITTDHEVVHQSKNPFERNLEKVVAMMALFAMMFGSDKSSAVFNVLRNIKTVFGTLEDGVRYQSLDEIESLEDEKKLTIDFELDTEQNYEGATMDVQFNQWWNKQLEQNRVVPHYRTGGCFIEFTRATSASVCNTIALSEEREFLVRGAVGSGKSTGLPSTLSRKGKVLLLETTRPLAENVCKQLRKEPFNLAPTLRMRGVTSFGSSNITIMTSGFALHYHANNANKLKDFDYIIIDECHSSLSSTMAFYCLLKEYDFQGKILKVSATPPGKECEFKPQHDVQLKIEPELSFHAFVTAQGSNSNADVVQHGNNILVYVASYNDVDQLSKLLIEKGYHVTKVDGRTMKLGSVEIPTKGSDAKKHFVVATNIIENGVTLDIDVVVDFGVKVVAELDADSRCMQYKKVSINYGERLQRLGRVGRVKPGHALRIGHTEVGLTSIPISIATEAAFLCFAYGLPVMTHNVTASLLGKCTTKQARAMMHYELPPFFMVELVMYNGTVHPQIEKLLQGYKLRDSTMHLSTLAIPSSGVSRWKTVREYKQLGIHIEASDDVRIPFASRNIPDKLYTEIWKAVQQHKADAGFGRLKSTCASSVSYTLSTQPHAIPRTIAIIDHLLAEERQKKECFESLNDTLCSTNFTLVGIVNKIRNRYLRDHSTHNIAVLQAAKAQLLEFNSKEIDPERLDDLMGYELLDTVQYQDKKSMRKCLKLEGQWDKHLMLNDVVVTGCVIVGGGWMIWEFYKQSQEMVEFQGKKRKVQKLKFRDARDRKMGREVYGDDGTIEHYFGAAYTEKGKKKGNNNTKGLGRKTRRFVHMYGFDPTEYSFVRFVDPLTGHAQDEGITADMSIVQEEIADIREKAMLNDDDLVDYIRQNPGIQAYYMKHGSDKAAAPDLTPHNPLLVCRSATIAGFPERETELRQTGPPKVVNMNEVPKVEKDQVAPEGKSIVSGLRNYNPISSIVCQLTNSSGSDTQTLFGIGYGPVIITNGHLFRNNNGTLLIRSHHGEFTIKNTTQLNIHHVAAKDMILIKMPKDFPPFPQRIYFRSPKADEKACLVGSRFQERHISSEVSDSTIVRPTSPGGFWKHWVSTRDGDCGLPLVSLKDGKIIGFHSLTSTKTDVNYFVPFTDNFEDEILGKLDSITWVRHWRHSSDKIAWNGLSLKEDYPSREFSVSKIISDLNGLFMDEVSEQSKYEKWVLQRLEGNLKAVGQSTSQLVTKHVVKGPCVLFQEYCGERPDALNFFKPFMGEYGPSKLNKEAFLKDFLKYAGPITIGEVDTDKFERAVLNVIKLFEDLDFGECAYVTDPDAIYDSLNLKAAVGALYQGKKKEYFETMSAFEKEDLLRLSCLRLFKGEMGVWNGSLKAELRAKEKLEQNKTRTFTAAPIDTLLGGKVCVDDFNNRFYSLNLEAPWSVGMTKFYGGWNKLLSKLPEGWIYCDADGSQFDSSLTPYLINSVVQIREHFMEPWDVGVRMLRNFYTEIIYTPILAPDGTIVKKFKGNNSGQPSTVVDNTIMVVLAMHYSMERENWSEEERKGDIVFFANGDDLIIAIKPEKESFLDNLQLNFLELGLKYDFSNRHKDVRDLWFMSHRGIEYQDMLIPKLEEERIVSILEWDRSTEIAHRAEAICAAMIEAWGYPDMLRHIREFYLWLMQHPWYKDLVKEGKLPYISESALKKLYTDQEINEHELAEYWRALVVDDNEQEDEVVYQSSGGSAVQSSQRQQAPQGQEGSIDAGRNQQSQRPQPPSDVVRHDGSQAQDVGQVSHTIPRLKNISKMRLPKVKGKIILSLDHIIDYKPDQLDLSNTRATHEQLQVWYSAIMNEYEVSESQMGVLLNGLMVWCIENGTSPNLNGEWVMMDGEEQVTYPLKPIIENAKPSFRQIMHHFSDAAEAYIEMRNRERPYMPRYGLIRNLRDMSLARYAFDFYEINSRTPVRAREAIVQMKAAALTNVSNKMFGLDGNVTTTTEDTERHTASDVNARMHHLMGVTQG
uniref:Genome polyprotein n=1 Tax=Basella rugose mosaic virus TaxID=373398 RepID=A0A7T1BYL3_9POTV|nr:polyprotein [Basella rugose mosaic virus]